MSEPYYRCKHCRGFYEVTFEKCKWCSYETPMLGADGRPRVFPDRETARAIQLAEYEQLPKEAHDDSMGPPAENLTVRCGCLHCGQEGHVYEAIEMRWMTTERMWACPCTTCGGRGFHMDIHPIDPVWQCADCKHWYTPEKFTQDYAKCPKCGSTLANGWFDDGDEDEDDEDFMDDEEADDLLEDMEALAADGSPLASKVEDEEIPWEDDVEPFDPAKIDEDAEFPLNGDGAVSQSEHSGEMPKNKDDIDFPYIRPPSPPPGESDDEEDIPF